MARRTLMGKDHPRRGVVPLSSVETGITGERPWWSLVVVPVCEASVVVVVVVVEVPLKLPVVVVVLVLLVLLVLEERLLPAGVIWLVRL